MQALLEKFELLAANIGQRPRVGTRKSRDYTSNRTPDYQNRSYSRDRGRDRRQVSFSRTCNGERSHSRDRSRDRERKSSREQNLWFRRGGRDNRTCYYCGRKGHILPNCYKRMNDEGIPIPGQNRTSRNNWKNKSVSSITNNQYQTGSDSDDDSNYGVNQME